VCRKPVGGPHQTHDGRIELVERCFLNLSGKQSHTEAHADFLEYRRRKPRITTCRHHALNPATIIIAIVWSGFTVWSIR